MKACIHRGSNQIGGTCIELEADGVRIVLDIGIPLDADDPATVPMLTFFCWDEIAIDILDTIFNNALHIDIRWSDYA